MNDQEELAALRRMAELEAKAGNAPAAPAQPSRMQSAVSDYMKAIPIAGPIGAGFVTAAKHLPDVQADLAYKAGDKVSEVATKLGAPAEWAAGAGLAANVGTQMFPPTPFLSGKAVGAAAAPAMVSGARRLMQSSIKPNAAARLGDSEKAITTMLERGINATEGGMSATKTRVGALESELQSILEKSPGKVDPYKAADNVKTAIKDVGLNLERAENLSDIEKVYDKFINHAAIKDLGDMPVALANKMKQAFYKELKDKAFVPGADLTASAKAQKAIAGGLRQEVAVAEPKVVPTLAEQSELLNVLKVAGPQAAREGNKNIIGIGALSPRLENVAVWMVDRYPWMKSLLARAMYSGSERLPEAAVGAGVSALPAAQQRTQQR